MQIQLKHRKIPQYEFNSELEMESSENQANMNNNIEIRNETINLEGNKKEVNIQGSLENKNDNSLGNKKNNNNSKKFIVIVLISFVVLVLICFGIVYPLVPKNGSNSENSDAEGSDIQSLIDKNKNSALIFETNDYYLIDKFSRRNKVFTQGLFFDTNSTLIESGGLYGKSKLRRFSLKNPDLSLIEIPLESNYFAEGACLYLEKYIFQLTWRERVVLVYEYDNKDVNNINIKLLRKIRLPEEIEEGWGITNEKENLIISDGTDKLYFLKPNSNMTSLEITNKILVRKFENDMSTTTGYKYLNELEFVKNRIFSNVWLTNFILVISPQDGTIIKLIDFSNLVQYEKELSPTDKEIDVLNGIAYDKATGNFVITGKNWNHLYLIKMKFDI